MDLRALTSRAVRPLLVLVVALAATWPAHAQIFSPGALSKAHAKLEGIKNCVKCHEPGNRFANARCTSCHTEIAARRDAARGLHGRLAPGELCASCHREHKGLSARIIDWGSAGKNAFNHARTGTPLKGAHRALECKACHVEKRIVDRDVKTLLDERGRRETFLGLKNDCSACHFDEHRGQFEKRCARCHVEDAFKPARRFVHNTMSDFKLTGKHRRVRCAKCHTSTSDEQTPSDVFPAPVSSRVVRYDDIPHDRCIDCHRDTHHKGTMGNRCEKCHVTNGWDRLKDIASDVGFHEKTRFPLRGAHLDVDCKSCHGPFTGEREPRWKGVPFERCADCHMDAHLSTIVDADGKTPDCRECHTVARFSPTLFSVDRHTTTRFPLDGSHRAVDCRLCHVPMKDSDTRVPSDVAQDRRRRDRPVVTSAFPMDIERDLTRCESCHRDPHDGQFADVIARVGCASCHQTTKSFTELTFDHDTQSRFALEGAHEKADCRQCHVPAETVVYRGTSARCADCHRDPHAGQFAEADTPAATTTDSSMELPRADCARCHVSERFTPSRFSHDDERMTDFRLRGRHRTLPCARCHRTVDLDDGGVVVKYTGVPKTCAECHVDQHEGRFNTFVP